VIWETLGDGTFTDPTLLNAEYIAGPTDKSTGFVKLYLTANGTEECISETNSDTLLATFRPLPSVNIGPNDTICEGDTAHILLTFTGTPPFTIVYSNGLISDTISNIILNPYQFAITPVVTTTYSLTYVHDLYCLGNVIPGSATVYVNPAPFAFLMSTTGNGAYCAGTNGVTLGLTGSQIGIIYTLYRNGNPVGTPKAGTNLPFTFGNFLIPGIYSVFGVDTTTSLNCGRAMADSITVTINPLPVVDFNADSTCIGELANFTVTGPDTPKIVLWQWDFGDGTTATYTNPENPVHLYPVTGLYTVTLVATDTNGCQRTILHIVQVSALPVALFSTSQTTCQTHPVGFFDASYSVPPITTYLVTWIWEFGDGTSDTIHYPANPDVSHSYAASGTFQVTLTVINNKGCADETTAQVTVTANPLAAFTTSATQCEDQQVQFTDASQTFGASTIIQWKWNFGDPTSGIYNTSLLQNPLHTYASPGIYLVRLIIITSTGCKDTVEQNVTIQDGPLADFVADTACFGSPTTLTSTSVANATSIVTYDWNFGDGSPHLSGPGPVIHTYASSGTYFATLQIVNSNGCIHDTTKTIKVLALPTAAFWTSSPACVGSAVTFNDQSTAPAGYITKWHWDFGDGNDTIINFPANQNVAHTYALAGTYAATLTVQTTDSCEASLTVYVNINNNPIAAFDYTDGCEEEAVQFTDLSSVNNGGAIMSWAWNFDDPGSGVLNNSTLQNPEHTFIYAGTYDVKLIIINVNGCSDTMVNPITIYELPSAAFLADSACFGNETHFTDTSTANSGTIVTWNWDFGDGTPNSTLQNPVHLYNTPGIYWVTLTVGNSEGCENDTTQEILVKEPPDAQFAFENNCQGLPTQFTDQSVTFVGWMTDWYWDFGDDSTSTLQNPTHVYLSSGTFDVKLIVTNSEGCTDSITHQVLIHQGPSSAFTYTSYYCPAGRVDFQSLATGNGGTITNYLWTFIPGYTSTIPNPTFTYPVPDSTYVVTLAVTDEYGCEDFAIDSTVLVNPGFEFTIEADTACYGIPTQFHATNLALGDSLMAVLWNFGDPTTGGANTSTLHDPVHLFSSPGSRIVKLVAWNSENCVDSVFREVQVDNTPIANFGSVSLPCDSMVQFYDSTNTSGMYITSWVWNFGDGTPPMTIVPPNSPDVAHPYSIEGIYQVSLTVTTSRGCSDSIVKTVHRYPCIISAFAQTETILCANQDVLFTDLSVPVEFIDSWEWIFGDGADTTYTIFSPEIGHDYPSEGTYLVQLIIMGTQNGSLFSDTSSLEIVVRTTPQANFSTFNVCLTDTSLFLNTSTTFAGDTLHYWWRFGDTSAGGKDTSNLLNPSYPYPQPGTFDVTLVALNTLGCRDTLVRPMRIYKLPLAGFTTTLPCKRHDIRFTDASIEGDTTFNYWFWNFGDPESRVDTSLLENPTYRYDSLATYPVLLLVQDEFGCMDTTLKFIKILPSPISEFTIEEDYDGKTGQLKFNNLSTGAIYYFWDFGNSKYSDQENPITTYTNDGTYRIYLASENDVVCTDTTFYTYLITFRGLFIPNAFSPGDNDPDIGQFLPKGMNLTSYHIQIFDGWGHVIFESKDLTPDGSPKEPWDGTYNGQLLPQGTYMWKIDAVFEGNVQWEGSYNGRSEGKTIGTVTLIR